MAIAAEPEEIRVPAVPVPTEELFREDARLVECRARVVAVDERGVRLDRTVFYPQGGGQAGDAGVLRAAPTAARSPSPTRARASEPGEIVHVPAPGQEARWRRCAPASRSWPRIDWERRHRHMRFHTATHLLCALVPHPVDGCSITADYARLDFHMTEPLDKEALDGRHRAAGGRGARGAPPLDQRRRARRQPAAGAQHERAAAARRGPRARCSRSRASTCSPAAARTWRNTAEIGAWS